MVNYIIAKTDDEYVAAALLFREYAAWLNIDLCFQNFEEELADLKSMYASPLGGIILCKKGNEYIGCIAFRPQQKETAELKRMYIKPVWQQKGIGSELLKRVLDLVKICGYLKVRLDTLDTMTPAMQLYAKHGFVQIPPYYYNPLDNAVYFEKAL